MSYNGLDPAAAPDLTLDVRNTFGIDAAMTRVKKAGGQILNGPMEVPGGSWIAQCSDPQGAMFAMVAPRR